jgi:hypothetical protein
VTIVVSLSGSVTAAEHEYRAFLHLTPPDERDGRETRRTLRWPAILIAGGVLLGALMICFYVLPYRRATGAGSAALASGELWLSLGCAGVLILCGLLTRWGVKRGL